jgi:thiamine-phosphate diphosphorylase/hydroxyethylthiazole kinase
VGTQAILSAISDATNVGTVSIGGINHSNVQRVIYQSQSPKKGLDGVAIVSAIMAADDPKASTEAFARLIKSPPSFALTPRPRRANEAEALVQEVPQIVRKMVEVHPLVHNMINFVVVNFVANIALSMCVFHRSTCPDFFLLTTSTAAHRPSWPLTATRPQT